MKALFKLSHCSRTASICHKISDTFLNCAVCCIRLCIYFLVSREGTCWSAVFFTLNWDSLLGEENEKWSLELLSSVFAFLHVKTFYLFARFDCPHVRLNQSAYAVIFFLKSKQQTDQIKMWFITSEKHCSGGLQSSGLQHNVKYTELKVRINVVFMQRNIWPMIKCSHVYLWCTADAWPTGSVKGWV